MSERKPCKSDLSDERWALIEPVITAWKAQHPSVSGHEGRYETRGTCTETKCCFFSASLVGLVWRFRETFTVNSL
ncbi:hypothetical protein AB0L75_43810, partial [Streptomyces sp. NPDC052101]